MPSPDKGRIVPFDRVREDHLAWQEDGDWLCAECGACLCRKCGHDPGCPQWAENTGHGLTFVYDPNNLPEPRTWRWDPDRRAWVPL